MLKLSKKADYALMAVNHLARHYGDSSYSARDIATQYRIPVGVLAKVLQRLAQMGLVRSQQGVNGGYVLAFPPEKVSALDVICAIDGPVQIVSCNPTEGVECEQTTTCIVREPMLLVNERIVGALSALTVAEMNSDGAKALVSLRGGAESLQS